MNIHPNLIYSMSGIIGFLVLSTATNGILKWRFPTRNFNEVSQRIKSWWILAGLFFLALLSTQKIAIVFFGLISFLALKEYFSIIETRRADRRVLFWAYLAIPLQYSLVWYEWYNMFIIFVPVYMFLFLPLRMVLIGDTDGFLKSIGTIQWGLMMMVFCLGHYAYLLVLGSDGNPNGGGPALVLFLVMTTQLNDVAQFLWGKTLGKRKIIPKVSPGKTWAGMIGGVATTTLLSCAVGPFLTPMSWQMSLFAGLLIGLCGFIGDVVMSAVKRDLGIKDSGALIPGHGGVLDRVDSLMYTAPVFLHFMLYFYY